jgi:asparagine synthase (glutamine-hydrolysing)
MDQPTIDGINVWFVSKAAHELGLKVAISGLGGDELFGGYPSFRDVPRWVRWMLAPSSIPCVGPMMRRAFQKMHGERLGLSPKAAGLVELGGSYPGAYLLRRGIFMPWELPELLGPDRAREGLEQLDPINHIGRTLVPDPVQSFARVATLESSLYMRNQLLRDADWASMAHSLEVRVPLVDAMLLAKLAGMGLAWAQRIGKSLLAEAPSRPVPSMNRRRKVGFVVPIAKWIENSILSEWKRVPLLRSPGCHWSRRWAHAIACGA